MEISDIYRGIDTFIARIDDYCRRPVAASVEEAEAWRQSPGLYYQAKIKCCNLLPSDLAEEAERLADSWSDYQNQFAKEPGDFIERIDAVNQSILAGEDWRRAYRRSRLYSRAIVKNISHVEFFALTLPTLIPEKSAKFRNIGAVAAGLFLAEKIGKYIFESSSETAKNPYDAVYGLNRVKALYELSSK